MPYIDRGDNLRIHYEIWGEGYPLVFLHGLGQNNFSWVYQISKFSSQYQCIAIEARGHGRSSKPEDISYGIPSMAADDVAVLDAMGIKEAILIGNSMGGMRLLQVNLIRPQVSAGNVIISTGTNLKRHFNPAIILAGVKHNYAQVINLVLKGAYSAHTRKHRPDLLQLHLQTQLNKWNFPDHVFLAAYQDPEGVFNWNIEEDVPRIKARTLLMVGEEDKLIPYKVNKMIADRLPRCEFRVLKNQAHMCHLEDFVTFNKMLQDFIDDANRLR